MSKKEKSTELKFIKEVLVNSNRFRHERDLVSAVLEDDVEYTISEVEDKIAKYLKGEVK